MVGVGDLNEHVCIYWPAYFFSARIRMRVTVVNLFVTTPVADPGFLVEGYCCMQILVATPTFRQNLDRFEKNYQPYTSPIRMNFF